METMEKVMYKAVYNLAELGTFDTFKEAFKAIFDELKKAIDNKEPILLQNLETTIWVENLNTKTPTFFYESRDLAFVEGWIVGGEWRG